MVRFPSPRRTERGFTLVELMIGVVIISVLATIAVYGVTKYIAAAKTSEATGMIGSIKAAQESFKDETFSYLKVSTSLADYFPVNSTPGQAKVAWAGTGATATNWRALGISPAGPVMFVYACTAGTAAENVEALGSGISISNWPTNLGQPWYAIKAMADLQRGGAYTVYAGGSFTNQIFSANEGQ
jgi:type IV pilus assembly protein PilA